MQKCCFLQSDGVPHLSVLQKLLWACSSLRHFRELYWGVSKCLLRLLFDGRTAKVSAPGWVITMPSAHLTTHFTYLKLIWYVHHKHDSLSLFNLLVHVCHLNCVKERTQEFYSLLI